MLGKSGKELADKYGLKLSRIVRCRTAHPCEDCDTEIQPGELAEFEEGRTPTYTNPDNWKNERQTGIAYWKKWRHEGRRNCRPKPNKEE